MILFYYSFVFADFSPQGIKIGNAKHFSVYERRDRVVGNKPKTSPPPKMMIKHKTA